MSSKSPVEALTIPVRPLLGTAANLAALAATGVVAGGTTAMVATAAGVGAVGAAVRGGKKAATARRASQARSATARGAGSGRSKPGTVGGGSGKGTPRAGGRSTAARGATVGKASGKTGGKTGVLGSLRRRSSAPTSRAAAATPVRAGGGRASSATPTAGRATARKGQAAPRGLARRAKAIANSPARKWAQGRTAAAWKGAKTATGRATKSTRATRRRAWRGLRKWVQHQIMGRRPTPPPAPRQMPTRVGTDLKAAFTRGILNPTAPAPAALGSIPRPVPSATVVPVQTSGGIMKDIARQMHAYAAEYDAPGALDIIAELDANLEGALQHVADAYKILSEKSRSKWPFDDAIVQKLAMIGECLDTAAQMARGVVPDIETIHEAELRRLRNPGVGQEKFDLSANGMV